MPASPTVRRARRTVAAPADRVFALLATPARHPTADASGMVEGAVTTDPVSAVGQVFTMDMAYEWDDGRVDRYRTDNHVDVFEAGRAIGWRVAAAGHPPLGWAWRYRLEPVGDETAVELEYDWTGTPPENVERYGVPSFDEDDLAASLACLATAVEDPAD